MKKIMEIINNEQEFSVSSAGRVNFNVTAKNRNFATVEAFKTLRSNLLFCGEDIKTVIVTSTRAGEGKSTVSVELAKSLAEIGKKTLLLDFDMRKSRLLRRTRDNHIAGFSELLSSQADISQVLYNTQNEYLDIIFSGAFPPNPADLLSLPRLPEILEKFKKMYDYIIIDSPPLGLVIDAAIVAPYCDGAIMVLSPGVIKTADAREVKEQLKKSGCKILGAVINQTDVRHRDLSLYSKRYYYYSAKRAKFTFKDAAEQKKRKRK